MRLAASLLFAALLARAQNPCEKGTLYLTIDTGSMQPANEIAAILRKHRVKATVFIANEKTLRGDRALDPAWAPFWKSFAADGHVFGSHTWRHWYLRGDQPDGTIAYSTPGPPPAKTTLNQQQLCDEIGQPREAFERMTGVKLAPIWRAPGGKTTPRALQFAAACGYKHIGWTPNGFLGDELPSQKFSNQLLLQRALRSIRDGDILLMHLGIRSRQDPYWPMLDPLLAGLKQKGFCFATIKT